MPRSPLLWNQSNKRLHRFGSLAIAVAHGIGVGARQLSFLGRLAVRLANGKNAAVEGRKSVFYSAGVEGGLLLPF